MNVYSAVLRICQELVGHHESGPKRDNFYIAFTKLYKMSSGTRAESSEVFDLRVLKP
jgi:hypothetical protein